MHLAAPMNRRDDDELGAVRRLTVRMLKAAEAGDDAHLARLRAARDARLDAFVAEGREGAAGAGGRQR